MGKVVFFAVAALVGCFAGAVYLWQSGTLQEYGFLQSDQTSKIRTTDPVEDVPKDANKQGEETKSEPVAEPVDPRVEASNANGVDNDTEQVVKTVPTPPLSTNPPLSPPTGHLNKLGEHGSPIITDKIEELDYVPSGKDFYAHFIRKREPLVLRGGAAEWPAYTFWKNESYLNSKYGDVIFDVEFQKKYNQEPPMRKTMNMSEFLRLYKSEEVYLDSPFPQSRMTEDLRVPYCLQCEELMSKISSTHLLFSNGGTSSSCHNDGYENLLTVISGKKEVLLANYTFTEFFHLDQLKTTTEKMLPHAPIDPEAVDLIKCPNLAKVPFHKVTLNAGDVLYIPQTWWHHVRSFESPNIAIALWFHVFSGDGEEEQENEAQQDADEENESEDEDAQKYMEGFAERVAKAPTTIECRSQHRPMSEVFWPKTDMSDQLNLEDPEKWVVTLASGYKMPMKGFGTAGLFDDSKEATLVALQTGYRLIDTAQANGYNETAVGLAVKESGIPREEVFIVSKVEPRNLGYDDTIRSVGESLERLQTSYIDLMLIHAMECEENEPGAFLTCEEGEPRGTWEDSWRALEALVQQGKIRSIGVSNFEVKDLQRLKEIATIPPSVVQNFFTPFYHDNATRKYCSENNIKYMGFSTLGAMYMREDFDKNPVTTNEGLKRIADNYDASVQQLVLKWALESDVIVIPKSKTPNHIKTNFHLSHIQLSEGQKLYFDSLDGLFDQTGTEEEVAPIKEKEEQVTASKESDGEEVATETRKAPVRDKSIIDKLVLTKKVEKSDQAIYVSSDDQWIYVLDAKTGDLYWKYGTTEDGGSMCAFNLDETVVYCGTDDNSIRAFNRFDGTLLWNFKTDGAVTSSTRIGADGTLFVGCVDGHIYNINPDGTLKWKKHLGEQVWSTPALKDGGKVVFIGAMADKPNNVFALDGKTGDVLWEHQTGGPVFSSPVLSADEKVMYICSYDANCYAFDAETGKVIWVFEADASFQSSPAISKSRGLMVVASGEGNVCGVNTTTGKIVWLYQAKGEFFSTPFMSPDGRVYVGSGKGEVLALNQSDGSLMWSFKTENDEMVYSSPKLSKDGTLYIGAVDGHLYALRSDDGKLVWKFKSNGPLVGTVRMLQDNAMEQD